MSILKNTTTTRLRKPLLILQSFVYLIDQFQPKLDLLSNLVYDGGEDS